jgi:DNA-binding transcriptional ArsR family regulator
MMTDAKPRTDLDDAFLALADPTRRAILARLATGEANVTELASPFGISQPAVSRHLKVLEDAGLIETRVSGTSRPRRLKPDAMRDLWDWLGTYRETWERSFRRLDALLDTLPDDPDTGDSP